MVNKILKVKEILDAFNRYFDPKYFNFSQKLNSEDYVEYKAHQEKIPKALKDKVKKKLEDSKLFEYAKNYEKTPLANTILPLFKLTADLLNDEDYQKQQLENLKFLAENEGYWIKKNRNIDNLLFFTISPIIEDLIKNFPDSISFFEEFKNEIKDSMDINTIIKSLGFIIEERKTLENMFTKSPMSELIKYQKWVFFDKIRKSDTGDFYLYFNDWALKNSQIIEHHVKAIFKILIKVQFLLDKVSIKDIKQRINEFKTIGYILYFLDRNDDYGNLVRIRIYRNATFHIGVKLIHDKRRQEKKLIFKDEYGQLEVTIDEFIKDFVKIIVFISTFNYIIGNEMIKHENKGKSLFQLNYEFAKEHGIKKFWQLSHLFRFKK